MHHAVFLFCCPFLFCLYPFLTLYMDSLRVGSLNINGGRDRHKRALVSEIMHQKKLNVVLLQETHSDVDTEVKWWMWWKGHYILSHGTNLSAGIAFLFMPDKRISIVKTEEFVKGRLALVKVVIEGVIFLLHKCLCTKPGTWKNYFL